MLPAPDAGSVLRQIQTPSAAPEHALVAPALTLPQTQESVTAAGAKIDVRQFKVGGVDAATAQVLQSSLMPFTGTAKTLSDLNAAAKAAQSELRRHGLFLAEVIIPPQKLSNGVIELQVFEGRLGNVDLNVKPEARISKTLVESTVDPLRGNPVIERDRVDGALLRLGDLRGIAVNSVLKPGDAPGIADLDINVGRGKRFASEVAYDNGGSEYTGRDRVYANFDAFDLAGRGDVASLRTQASAGTRYVQGSWLVPVNGLGTRVGPIAGWMSYELGTAQFDPLQAQGNARWLGIQVQHPLIRSQDQSLYVQGSLGMRRFEDEVRALGIDSRKSVDDYASIGLAGQVHDAYDGLDNYSVTVSSGRLGFEDEADAALDAQSYRTAGRYVTYALSASRLQPLTMKDSLLLAAQAQFANGNLDSSEKFSLGGMNAVRGYPSSDSPSDQAVVLTWEYRRILDMTLSGRWSASVFGDYGFGRLHETPLANDVDNTRDIHSHGLGLNYDNDAGLSVRGFVAWRGNTPAQTDDRSAQMLVQASFSF
jgi:hemolysin activation/secretion protein